MKVSGYGTPLQPYLIDSGPGYFHEMWVVGQFTIQSSSVSLNTTVRIDAVNNVVITLPVESMEPASELHVLVDAPEGASVSFTNVGTWFSPSTGAGLYRFVLLDGAWWGTKAVALAA